ncbi:type II toxin-antitoxin system RelE/ParE family toxin [Bacillus sp. JJ1566]|uniref:type II toxin-antitoxin system RelE/ParE family toxin n=1 Tax=Bacillus sp. JJ1566 TaxID=3122961 RepID=UPI003000B62B
MEKSEFEIKITPKAYEDLDEIYGYIANELYNEDAADNLLEKMETNIMRLKEFPFSCSYVRDEILKNKGYRKLIVDNYIIFHLVNESDKEVVIMRVLYGKQKYQDLI